MDGNVRLSATVISSMGNDSYKDDFYFNGNFANCHNTQSIQCSFEKAANNYVFAVSDSLGVDNGEYDSISAVREIKKYHESAKLQQFSLESISERIYEAVQLSSNLIYSQSVIASQNSSRLTGFSSLIIDNSRASIMNLGNNGAFLFRQGVQKDLFSSLRNGGRKSEKLRSLGITPTAPDLYNDKEKILKLAEEESKTKIKITPSFELEEDDVIILCSDGLLNAISRSRLEAVVDSGFEPSKMASVLYHEAIKGRAEDGITVMVIKVEEIRSLAFGYSNKRANQVDLDNETDSEEEEEHSGRNVVNYILGFVCVLVISGVLFMGYLIFTNSGILGSDREEDKDISQSTVTAGNTTAEDTTIADDTSTVDPSKETTGDPSGDSQSITNPSNNGTDNSSGDGSGAVTEDNPDKDNNNGNENSDSEYDIYIVKSGDTLSAISNKYYGDKNKYNVIMKYNNILKDNSLYVGQELKIPKIK